MHPGLRDTTAHRSSSFYEGRRGVSSSLTGAQGEMEPPGTLMVHRFSRLRESVQGLHLRPGSGASVQGLCLRPAFRSVFRASVQCQRPWPVSQASAWRSCPASYTGLLGGVHLGNVCLVPGTAHPLGLLRTHSGLFAPMSSGPLCLGVNTCLSWSRIRPSSHCGELFQHRLTQSLPSAARAGSRTSV